MGYYQPFLLIGSGLITVAAGLIYTWDLNTSIDKIIGYQILCGVSLGIGVQISIVVASVKSPLADQAIATSTVLCTSRLCLRKPSCLHELMAISLSVYLRRFWSRRNRLDSQQSDSSDAAKERASRGP